MKILVLGCGPAGLLAAHAASYIAEAQVAIVSAKKKSELFGCQYLHGPIPGLDVATTTVTYDLLGTPEEYAMKVYGSRLMAGTVSPSALTGSHPAWDIRAAYHQLWEMWEPYVGDVTLDPFMIQPMFDYHAPDLVVSSVPLPVICQKPEEHAFRTQDCWAIGDAPERGQYAPVNVADDTVLCSGTRDTGWYRASKVFGYSTVEWSGLSPKPPISGVVKFQKPLATTCDCWPDVVKVGRYGTWTKGALSHEAFNTTVRVLQERFL